MNRLYHVPLSPFCRKVRLVLAEKKIEVELHEERYWEPTAEFLRRNPAGKVPTLKFDGKFLADSQAICEYLEERVPSPPLMPSTAAARYEVRRLVFWFDEIYLLRRFGGRVGLVAAGSVLARKARAVQCLAGQMRKSAL